MTNEQARQQVIETIAEHICTLNLDVNSWEELKDYAKTAWKLEAESLFELTYPSGQPMIGILDEDQTLEDGYGLGDAYVEYVKCLKESRWRKTL